MPGILPLSQRARYTKRMGEAVLPPTRAAASEAFSPYALIAAGRPFLFIGPEGATPARLIARFHCGWHVEPGDADSLIALLELLAASRGLVPAAGERARHAFLSFCGLPAGTARILAIRTAGVPGAEGTKSAAAGA